MTFGIGPTEFDLDAEQRGISRSPASFLAKFQQSRSERPATSTDRKYQFIEARNYRTHIDAKFVYHKEGASTHCFPFENDADDRWRTTSDNGFMANWSTTLLLFPIKTLETSWCLQIFERATIAFEGSTSKGIMTKSKTGR